MLYEVITAFAGKAENLCKPFDLSNAKANRGKNINFGFAIEAAIALGFVYLSAHGLRLTMRGYETALVGEIDDICNVISMYLIINGSDLPTAPDDVTPY